MGQTDCFIMTFNIANPASFDNIKKVWYPELTRHAPTIPVLLVGTKKDLREDPETGQRLSQKRLRPVDSNAAENLASELGLSGYHECSALTQEGLKETMDHAIKIVLAKIEAGEANQKRARDRRRRWQCAIC